MVYDHSNEEMIIHFKAKNRAINLLVMALGISVLSVTSMTLYAGYRLLVWLMEL
jgi:hypothetical protein